MLMQFSFLLLLTLRATAGLSGPDNSRYHFASREDSLHGENPERAFNASELPNENEFDKPRVPVASHSRRAQYSRALQEDLVEQEALRPGSAWPGLPEYYVDEPDTSYDVDEPAAKLSKRGTGRVIRQDTHVEPEMKFVSQGKGIFISPKIEDLVDFAYLDYAGSGVTVYMHEPGINMENIEFTGALPAGVTRGSIEWLIPAKDTDGNAFPQVNSDPDGHGTCLSDKVVGVNYGLAKGANLKVVPRFKQYKDAQMQAGLQIIIDDMKKEKGKNDNYFAVVNLSYRLRAGTTQDTIATYRKLYQQMVDLGALLVTAAGNDGLPLGLQQLNSYPQMFALEDSFKNSMLVVGGVDVNGVKWSKSNYGSIVEIWAPALVDEKKDIGITCAGKDGTNPPDQDALGTSVGTAMVSALAAYFYSSYAKLQVAGAAPKVKQELLSAAFARLVPGIKCIWNLQSSNKQCA